jgi:hypothetical protein
MSLWTLIKLTAALCVIAVMAFTGMLAYHVAVAPLGGVFAKIIPDPVRVASGQSDVDFAKMLDAAEMPDIDPGEKSFQKAHELLAVGKPDEAREKLTTIVNVFPASAAAPVARRIVGEMNLDEILSTSHMEGKKIHVVKRGDSFLGIAGQNKTTIDCMMHLNSMMELKGIQPGDELVVMPLEFHLLVEPRRKSLSLWDGGRFIAAHHDQLQDRGTRRQTRPAPVQGLPRRQQGHPDRQTLRANPRLGRCRGKTRRRHPPPPAGHGGNQPAHQSRQRGGDPVTGVPSPVLHPTHRIPKLPPCNSSNSKNPRSNSNANSKKSGQSRPLKTSTCPPRFP